MSDDEGMGPSEAERAMQKRRQGGGVLDEDAQDLLDANRKLRDQMEAEINEMKQRSDERKKEREEEDKKNAARRAEEEARRKTEEEERKRKKEEEEQARRAKRAEKMAEFEKFKNPAKPNFVITKKEGGGVSVGTEGEEGGEKKSKEQLEAEKKAILAQRIQPLSIDGFDQGKLTEKAKDLHQLVFRLESEKYDLEKRFKEQQYDMMELAERARQMNRVGKGGLKRIQLGVDDEVDKIQERFAGAPAKIVMVGKFDRTVDHRSYGEKSTVFHGPTVAFPASRVNPQKIVKWDQSTGLPLYEFLPGFSADDEEGGGEEGEEEE